jgi:hypothetical protein
MEKPMNTRKISQSIDQHCRLLRIAATTIAAGKLVRTGSADAQSRTAKPIPPVNPGQAGTHKLFETLKEIG